SSPTTHSADSDPGADNAPAPPAPRAVAPAKSAAAPAPAEPDSVIEAAAETAPRPPSGEIRETPTPDLRPQTPPPEPASSTQLSVEPTAAEIVPATRNASPPPELPAPPPPEEKAGPGKAETAEPPPAKPVPGELWRRVIEEVAHVPERHQLKLIMQELKPVSFIDGVLEVGVDDEVPPEHAAEIAKPENDRVIQRCFSRVSPVPGGHVSIKRWIPGVSDDRKVLTRSPAVWKKLQENPFILEACSLLNAKIIDVRG
ncbi:MAG: hypothetical protein GXP31_09360, partial [Kiritimatiellaeota bacterium]|nr:hypothetical protein [Kiritimatiellota bacterium]